MYEASVSVELRTLDGRNALVTRSKHVNDADVVKGLGEDKGLEERTLVNFFARRSSQRQSRSRRNAPSRPSHHGNEQAKS